VLKKRRLGGFVFVDDVMRVDDGVLREFILVSVGLGINPSA
jgi:hypothetical protein